PSGYCSPRQRGFGRAGCLPGARPFHSTDRLGSGARRESIAQRRMGSMTAITARLSTLRRPRAGGNQRAAYLYLVPAFVVMGFITIYPLLYQVYMSFTNTELKHLNVRLGLTPDFVGLQNYINILTSALAIPNFDFLRIIIYNLWWALSNVAIHLVIGVGVALLLNSRGLWLRKFYRALFI